MHFRIVIYCLYDNTWSNNKCNNTWSRCEFMICMMNDDFLHPQSDYTICQRHTTVTNSTNVQNVNDHINQTQMTRTICFRLVTSALCCIRLLCRFWLRLRPEWLHLVNEVFHLAVESSDLHCNIFDGKLWLFSQWSMSLQRLHWLVPLL